MFKVGDKVKFNLDIDTTDRSSYSNGSNADILKTRYPNRSNVFTVERVISGQLFYFRDKIAIDGCCDHLYYVDRFKVCPGIKLRRKRV